MEICELEGASPGADSEEPPSKMCCFRIRYTPATLGRHPNFWVRLKTIPTWLCHRTDRGSSKVGRALAPTTRAIIKCPKTKLSNSLRIMKA